MAEPPRKRPRRSLSPPAPRAALGAPSLSTPTTTTAAVPAPATATAPETTASTSRKALASCPIHPPAQYSQPTPFQQPLHLTSFSYSPTRQLLLESHNKDDSLSYYREPRLGSDLNYGFEHAVWRDGTVDEGLDALLETLDHWARSDPSGAAADLLAKTALITWRGMLTKLMLAVYECDNVANGRRADGWEMNAMLVEDCLHLEESNPPVKLAAKAESERSGPGALPSYYGYSFEAYCTSSTPTVLAPSNPYAPHPSRTRHDDEFSIPNANVQWCSVVKTNLGGCRTIVGGEVDCLRPTADITRGVSTNDFIELKTNLVIQSQRDEINFERQKLLKHYVQSFLLGVPTVTVGFRTRQGQLANLQSFNTLDLPRLARGKPHAWDPTACLASANSLLDFIRHTLSTATSAPASANGDKPASSPFPPVFRISFSPQASTSSGSLPAVSIRQLTAEEVESEVLGGKKPIAGGRIGFLPRRWVEAATARRAHNRAAAEAGREGLSNGTSSAHSASSSQTKPRAVPPRPPPPPPPVAATSSPFETATSAPGTPSTVGGSAHAPPLSTSATTGRLGGVAALLKR